MGLKYDLRARLSVDNSDDFLFQVVYILSTFVGGDLSGVPPGVSPGM